MKYSIVATVAVGLIGSAKTAPVAPQDANAPAKRLYPYPYGYPYGLNIRQCSADEDCNEGHYCITESGTCSYQTREAVMAEEEEASANEKRNPSPKAKRILPYPYQPWSSPSYLQDIAPVKKGECTSDADCEGDHYCVTESETCSVETREAVMADQNGAEKRSPDSERTVAKRFGLPYYPPGYIPTHPSILPIKKGECTSDADCEGDHYCVTETETCSEQTREAVMAEQEESAGNNEKRSAESKDKRIVPTWYDAYRPSYLQNLPTAQDRSCSTDDDCEGDYYCITETQSCSAKTREAAMAETEE